MRKLNESLKNLKIAEELKGIQSFLKILLEVFDLRQKLQENYSSEILNLNWTDERVQIILLELIKFEELFIVMNV